MGSIWGLLGSLRLERSPSDGAPIKSMVLVAVMLVGGHVACQLQACTVDSTGSVFTIASYQHGTHLQYLRISQFFATVAASDVDARRGRNSAVCELDSSVEPLTWTRSTLCLQLGTISIRKFSDLFSFETQILGSLFFRSTRLEARSWEQPMSLKLFSLQAHAC